MRTLAPISPSVQPARSTEIETVRAINEARRKREESARFQKLARQSRAWQARCATALVVAEDRPRPQPESAKPIACDPNGGDALMASSQASVKAATSAYTAE
jgi:hypothetical protein